MCHDDNRDKRRSREMNSEMKKWWFEWARVGWIMRVAEDRKCDV
jgi:hypothetical protein